MIMILKNDEQLYLFGKSLSIAYLIVILLITFEKKKSLNRNRKVTEGEKIVNNKTG